MEELYLEYSQHRRVIREADPEDGWDRGNTDTEYHFKGRFRSTPPSSYYEIVAVDFEPVVGRFYHFVVAIYDTGDSFGWDKNGGIEAMEVFEDFNAAEEFHTFLESEEASGYTAKFKGKEYHIPWKGYFERLSYIEIVTAVFVG